MAMLTLTVIDGQLILNGFKVIVDVSGKNFKIKGKHDYPVEIEFTVDGEDFSIAQDWDLNRAALYSDLEDGCRYGTEQIKIPEDHGVLQFLKPFPDQRPT